MLFPPLLLFAITINIIYLVLKFTGGKYVLDKPDSRKRHKDAIPQIGGIVFGPLYLLIIWCYSLAPIWYIIGCLVSIIIGLIDDSKPIRWEAKLLVQLGLMVYIILIFWNNINFITFYDYSLLSNKTFLLFLFILWFIGIFNAVNLIDGLDGLAAGFMIILCFATSLSQSHIFNEINFILCYMLIGFLIFNQRKAKIFMGDAGSLFLGFHVAVLPLLYFNESSIMGQLQMTPFIFLVSYLIADTARVFFTRLIAKKNPMTPDTIHFHHLVLKQSHSYLSAIASIYFLSALSSVFAVFSFYSNLTQTVMLFHLAALLFFILTPPIETYVPIIAKIVSPFYNWQKSNIIGKPSLLRSGFMGVMVLGIVFTSINSHFLAYLIMPDTLLSIFLLIIFILFNGISKISRYALKIGFILLLSSATYSVEITLLSKVFFVFTLISFVVFTFQRRYGTMINKYSSLDFLILIICISGIAIPFSILSISGWFFIRILAIWFGLSFLTRRLIYY